jgi:hypothetical protein
MSTPGFPPKDPEQRRRKNADELADYAVTLPAETAPGAPEMPDPPKGTVLWHPDTVWFWGVMSRSPQARLWGSTDWAHLIETLRVYERWVTTPSDTSYIALERAVRSRTALMGYTHGDRLRLRMRAVVTLPPESEDGPPAGTRTSTGHGRKRDTSRFSVVGDESAG